MTECELSFSGRALSQTTQSPMHPLCKRILQEKKCTFMLAHFKWLIQAAHAIILYTWEKEKNLCTLTPTHAETHTFA